MIAASSWPLQRPASFTDTPRQDRPALPGSWLAGAFAGSLALLIGLLSDAGLGVDIFTPASAPFLAWLALCFGAAWLTRRARGRLGAAVHEGALHFGLLSVMMLMGAVASYPVAAISHGFVDETLAASDAALRFDWVAWYETVAAHPSLQWLGWCAYQSGYLSPAILLGYFAWTRRTGDARALIATFWLAAVIALALFTVMPAVGPFARDWHGPIPYMPDSALWQPVLIPALRAHAMHSIDLGELRGLVSAPSFHTAGAVVFIAAAWPHARLRWPLTLLNVAMLFSTPVEGTHYLTDMLLGALVASGSVIVVDAAMILWARAGAPGSVRRR